MVEFPEASNADLSELRELLDERRIRRLAHDYAAAADTLDGARYAALFTPDGSFQVKQIGSPEWLLRLVGSRELATVPDYLKAHVLTQHFVCNHRIDMRGDSAVGEVYCVAGHVNELDGRRENMMQFLRYVDRYVRTTDGWAFARRELHTRWIQYEAVATSPQELQHAAAPVRLAEDAWPPVS